MNKLLDAVRCHVPLASNDPIDRMAAGRDLWPRDTLGIALGETPVGPDVVCWPEHHEQVEALLAWASAAGVPLVPYGAGSGVCGGAVGHPSAVAVDLKRLHRILALDRERSVVSVQAGMLGQHLEDRLAPHGLATRHSPSSIWCSTVGGWAAARSAGQFSSLYGKFEDMVLGMRVATPSGTHRTGWHTPRGAEDLGPLFMGSEGTLGIITELDVRVVPLASHRWLRGYAFPSLVRAWDAMQGIMQADLKPAVLRLYCPVDTQIGGRLGGGGERRKSLMKRLAKRVGSRALAAMDGIDALRQRELSTALAAPRLLNRVADGLGREVMLIIGWEGEEARVRQQVEAARPFLDPGRDLGAEPGEHWYAHRHDVSYKLAPIFERGGFADTMEVATTWSRLPALYRAVRQALGRHTAVMAHFSHAYPEGCSIYFSFAGTGSLERYDATWSEALEAARRAGGTITHHHGVGQLKARAAAKELGNALRVYHLRKGRLDPAGIMNPGRLFQGQVDSHQGPPPPEGEGPLYRLHRQDLLAEVDPWAEPEHIQRALAEHGFGLRLPPDRPLAPWLQAFRVEAFERDEVPFFGIQARYEDGCAARLGVSPRSAAGPDLRWGLLRDAHAELIEVPLIRAQDGPRAPRAPEIRGEEDGE
jgi:alkyldihydroxyacetonephosphate synthase